MTKATARFLLDLINRQTLNVGAPDFDEVLPILLAARAELLAVLRDNSSDGAAPNDG